MISNLEYNLTLIYLTIYTLIVGYAILKFFIYKPKSEVKEARK